MATRVRIQEGSLGRHNLVKCWSASLGDLCMSLTQAATEQQWEPRQVKSVDLNEHKNEHNHRGLPMALVAILNILAGPFFLRQIIF